MLNIYNFNSVL